MTPQILLTAILFRALFYVAGIVAAAVIAAYLRAIALRAPSPLDEPSQSPLSRPCGRVSTIAGVPDNG